MLGLQSKGRLDEFIDKLPAVQKLLEIKPLHVKSVWSFTAIPSLTLATTKLAVSITNWPSAYLFSSVNRKQNKTNSVVFPLSCIVFIIITVGHVICK
jgi:hypothetical protein